MEHSRLLELLGEMSLEEKINQLFQGNSMFYEEDGIATGPASQQGFTEKTIRETGTVLGIIGAALSTAAEPFFPFPWHRVRPLTPSWQKQVRK